MKKKKIGLLCLIAVLAVLCAAYGILQRENADREQKQAQKEQEQSEASRVFLAQIKDVQKLAWKNETGTLGFVLEDGVWYYEEDRSFPLDPSALNIMVQNVAALEATRAFAAADSPEEYGLAEPADTLTVTDKNGQETVLLFGGSYEGSRYACRADDPDTVYLIPSSSVSPLQKGILDMMVLPVIPADSSAYSSLKIETEQGSREAEEEERTAFSVFHFTGAAFYAPSEEELTSCGLSEPTAVFTLVYTEEDAEKTLVLSVGALTEDGDSYYARTDDVNAVCLIDAASVDALLNPQKEETGE